MSQEKEIKLVYSIQGNQEVVQRIAQRTVEVQGASLIPFLKDGLKVLDLGCGPGSITVGIAKHVLPSGSVTAYDMDAKSLEIAAAAAKEKGISNITFVQGSIEKLPFEDSSFDVVWTHAILCHTWSKRSVYLPEIHRVLKKNGQGIYAARDIDSTVIYPESPFIIKAFDLIGQVIEKNGGDFKIGRKLTVEIAPYGFQTVFSRLISEEYPTQLSLNMFDLVKEGLLNQQEADQFWKEFHLNWDILKNNPNSAKFMIWAEAIFKTV